MEVSFFSLGGIFLPLHTSYPDFWLFYLFHATTISPNFAHELFTRTQTLCFPFTQKRHQILSFRSVCFAAGRLPLDFYWEKLCSILISQIKKSAREREEHFKTPFIAFLRKKCRKMGRKPSVVACFPNNFRSSLFLSASF